MKNAIILCSGGLDSVVTAHYVKKKLNYKNLKILFFNYGQRSLKAERKASKICSKDLNAKFIEVKIGFLKKISTSLINLNKKIKKINRKDLKNTKKESEKFYVPFRNGIFLSYAIALANSLFIKNKKIWDIFVGFKCEGKEAYPDTTHEFVKIMNQLIKLTKIKGKIKAPLIKKDKDEIVLLGKKLGVDLKKTHSCYISQKEHCGTCLGCALRKAAFYWANIKDKTKYKNNEQAYF